VPPLRAEVVGGGVDAHVRGLEDLERLGHDLWANTVPADHGELDR
jgi:hypothetical protein